MGCVVYKVCSNKECKYEGKPQPIENFNKCSSSEDELQVWCKCCKKEAHKESNPRTNLKNNPKNNPNRVKVKKVSEDGKTKQLTVGLKQARGWLETGEGLPVEGQDYGVVIPITAEVSKPKISKSKKFKTGEQAANEILRRATTDTIQIRKAKDKGLKREHLNEFVERWNVTTHCEATGVEFEPEGIRQKSPDKIFHKGTYRDEHKNVQITCLGFNLLKNRYGDEAAKAFILDASFSMVSRDKELVNEA